MIFSQETEMKNSCCKQESIKGTSLAFFLLPIEYHEVCVQRKLLFGVVNHANIWEALESTSKAVRVSLSRIEHLSVWRRGSAWRAYCGKFRNMLNCSEVVTSPLRANLWNEDAAYFSTVRTAPHVSLYRIIPRFLRRGNSKK